MTSIDGARLVAQAAIALLLLAIVVVLGEIDATNQREHQRTRHAVCELLDHVGADASSAADVEACTIP